MTHLAAFTDVKALQLAQAIRKLNADLSGLSMTVANYHDPNDYRTPMFAERLRIAREKAAHVNAALQALEDALS